ncbi:MAG TPA: glycosyltransferase family A protein [Mucilaginibacter sp.]
MGKKISLIVPTYGRYKELEELLASLAVQSCPADDFEVIIVDQNDKIDLAPAVEKYAARLDIVHKKVTEKGIARAKNTGLAMAKAPIVTFPDDDCTYYPDTIEKALKYLESDRETDIVYGRLYDRTTGKNIMRNWPADQKKVDIFNFHYTYSAITAFIRRNEIVFDTDFGVGSAYGIGEELDYLLQTFKHKLTSNYTPYIEIWHPELNPNVMTDEKVYYYARGYGAICKKHAGTAMILTLLLSMSFQFLLMVKWLVLFKKELAKKRWLAFKGRLDGFFSYKGKPLK